MANANGASYLISLNLKKLNDAGRPEGVEPRAYYQGLQEKAKTGPIFNDRTVTFIQFLDLELDKQELQWVATNYQVLDGKMSIRELGLVIDYLRHERPDLKGLTYAKAKEDSDTWHKQFVVKHELGSYQTNNVVLDLSADGRWVDVPAEDLKTEGELMGHCVGGYTKAVAGGKTKIYSLRDTKGQPHVTVEVTNGKVIQIQGKSNKRPVSKYHKPLEGLIRKLELPITACTVDYISDPKMLEDKFNSSRKDHSIRARILHNKNVPMRLLEQAAEKYKSGEYGDIDCEAAAGSPRATPKILLGLSKIKNPQIVSALASNKNVGKKATHNLVSTCCGYKTSGYTIERLVLAGKLSKEDFEALCTSRSKKESLIDWTARSSRVKPKVLEWAYEAATKLPNSGSVSLILRNFASNPNASEQLLIDLLKIPDCVRNVCWRRGLPDSVLRTILAGGTKSIKFLMENRHLPPEVVKDLAVHKQVAVRVYLARSMHASKFDVANILVQDKHERVRAALAADIPAEEWDFGVPLEILEKLEKDPVREIAARATQSIQIRAQDEAEDFDDDIDDEEEDDGEEDFTEDDDD